MTLTTTIILNNGVEMPYFGLGVWKMKNGPETINAVKSALQAGYRHIDTAQLYANEESVGEGIRQSNIPREEIFVTSKVEISNFGYQQTLDSVDESLKKFGYDYFDLFLLHFPVIDLWKESYRAVEELRQAGKLHAIGVSNFMIEQLEPLLKEFKTVPAVNQVEFHPYLFRRELLEFCRTSNIQLEGYSPLVRGKRLNDPKLTEIAKKYDKTPAQILIRWSLQHKVITIPKSSNPDRIRENADVFDFEISDEDMEIINGFDEDYGSPWSKVDKNFQRLVSTRIVRKLNSWRF